MNLKPRACTLFVSFALSASIAQAIDCSSLPTQFTGNEFPSGDFFTNFQNACYTIPLAPQGTSKTDLNDTYWQLFYKVDPRYQLIIVGSFPNARYFSLTANDDHYLVSQALLDTNIVPLTSSYVNPYQPGVPYASGQQYAAAINLGGTSGTTETGCTMNGYNVAANSLDGTLRHQGLNWNTDTPVFQQITNLPFHVVDVPQHTNPPRAGYLMVRAYVDINTDDPRTTPSVIVRDVATGCAYPAAYALETLQVVATTGANAWLDQQQYNAHGDYDSNYLPWLCYAADSRNSVSWFRDGQMVKLPNPYGIYLNANLPSSLPATLAAAGEVMRLRFRVPTTPPTPCTDGCARSGNEQMRYMGLSFYPSSGATIASVADYQITQDTNGYATLIVGTGAAIPSWITPANGYTFLDLTAGPGYQYLNNIQIRDILASSSFACSAQNVPYKTSIWSPAGSMMGDYLPVVDYPLAASLPAVASELVGPSACGILPIGVPATSPSCALLPGNPMTVAPILAPSAGQVPIAAQPLPPITITGSGFGFLPNGLPYTGNSNYLEITDYTQNWNAGYTGSSCTVSISKWADNRIELVANVNVNGRCPLAAGDQIGISVWNPQTMAGPGVVTVTVAAAPVPSFALGSNSALVGSAAGSGSVRLITSGPWTATSNTSWLTLSSLSGVGNSLVQYTYAANSSPSPQTGTLTIAGLTFTVTQAGTSYTAVTPMTTLVTAGLNAPQGVAVDAQGNVYIADTGNNAVKEWTPATQQVKPLVSSGLSNPTGIAVDSQGNVYIADSGNRAIEEWSAINHQTTALISGLSNPSAVAVDALKNVYFSDAGSNSIEEWNAAGQQLTTLVASGLSNPRGLAVDVTGNVYFANTGDNAVGEWSALTQQVTTLVTSGLSGPIGMAVDGQGNAYFADTGNNAIKQWNAGAQQVVTLVSSGLSSPAGVAVDAQGNLYVADQGNNAIKEFTFAYLSLGSTSLYESAPAGADSVALQILPANTPLSATSNQSWLTITSVAGGVINFSFQANSGASRTASITVLGEQITVSQSGVTPGSLNKSAGDSQSTLTGQVFPVSLQVTVLDYGIPIQGAAVTFRINPGPGGAGGTWSSTPPMPILTDQNGNAVAPALTANNIAGQFTVTASVNGLSVAFTLTIQAYALGTSSVVVGSALGNGSVILVASAPWTVTSNASWLHVMGGSASGTGSSLIQFSYDANSSPGPQTGTLTIAGLTFTVTQVSANYVPVYPVLTLVSAGLNLPQGVAVDAQGNVYIADTGNNVIEEWSASTQQVTTLPLYGLSRPIGVAVDSLSNLYVADSGNHAIKQWNFSLNQMNALVAGLNDPYGLAVDVQGNVYFSDPGNNAIEEWTAADQQVTTLAVPSGPPGPIGLAVDKLGNVDFVNAGADAIEQWNVATQQATVRVSSGINEPSGLAVDGQGNIYFADTGNNAIKQWNAASQQVVTLVSSGLSQPAGVAVDAQGDVYVADQNNNAVKEVTLAFLSLSATSLKEGASAGSGSLTAQVIPAGTPLTASSDQSWLTITSVAGGFVNFAFQNNTFTASRTAHITVAGAQVTVTQSGNTAGNLTKTAGDGQTTVIGQAFPIALQVTMTDSKGAPVQGAAVTFSVIAGSTGAGGTWSPTPPMPILTDQNGNARAPALTANNLEGQFTVTATVSSLSVTFTLTNEFIALGTSSIAVGSGPGNGNLLVAATGPWTATSNASWLTVAAGSASGKGNGVIHFGYAANLNASSQTGTLTVSGMTFTVTQAGTSYSPVSPITTLLSSGLKNPQGVAIDGQGNVYIADSTNNAIKKWAASTQTVSTLVSSGLNSPAGIAVDSYGDVYVADTKDNAIKEWIAATQQVTTLVSLGLSTPSGVAVDSQGNIYFSDSGHNSIKEWVAASGTVTTLVSSGLNSPRGVAVDTQGNVYFADNKNNSVKEWTVANQLVAPLVSTGLSGPYGVAVDGEGNVYLTDTGNNAIKQWNTAAQQLTTLVSAGLNAPRGIAVDAQGNLYIADTNDNAIKKMTLAYLSFSASSLNEASQSGTDAVKVQVLPTTTAWIATSDQTWLTIASTANGTINFSFKANPSPNSRTAHITVLGLQATVTQSGDAPATITKTAGTGQSTLVGQAFPMALQVKVKDAAGKTLQGAPVTFTVVPGAKGASGTFSSSPPMPILTNASGMATAPMLTANHTPGNFTVTVTAGSLTTTFSLSVTAQ